MNDLIPGSAVIGVWLIALAIVIAIIQAIRNFTDRLYGWAWGFVGMGMIAATLLYFSIVQLLHS